MRPTIYVLPANRRGKVPELLGVNSERGAQGIIVELERMGFQVRFFDVNNWPWNPMARQSSMLKAIDPLRALRILFARPRPDVILSYYESGVLCLALLGSLLIFRVPFVIIDTGLGSASKLRAMIMRLVIPRASAIITFASIQVEHIRTHYKTRALVEFIPVHVDSDFYAPGPSSGSGDYILAVGDDISRDYETLLMAVDVLAVRLVLKTQLVSEDKHSHPNLTVISARLTDRELRDLYDQAKLVVVPLHPSMAAGGVTALLEGMAMGKAQIVSNSIGLRDYVRDGENCLVAPCHDADTLRETIDRLLRDEDLRNRLGKNARSYAQTHFSQKQFAQRLADRIGKLLQQ